MRAFFKRRVWYLETRGDKTFLYPQGQGKKTGEVPTLDITCLPNVTLLAFSYLLRISNVEFQICVKLTPFFFELFSKEGDCINPIQKQGYFVFGPVFTEFCDYLMQISSLNFPVHTRLGNWPWNLAVIENPHRPSRLIRLSIILITWWEQCAVATW